MRGDLNEQFTRAQSAAEPEPRRKWLIALIIGLVVGLAIVFIAGGIFLVKTLDKFVSATPDKSSSSYSDEEAGDIAFGKNMKSSSKSTTSKADSVANASSNFKYGTVSGTTYKSEFSGVSFTAPADWTVTGYSGSSLISPQDLSANDEYYLNSVKIDYDMIRSLGCASADDVLSKYTASLKSESDKVLDDSATATIGGNHFKGVIYEENLQNLSTQYIEFLVAEVNGYVMQIQISASSTDNLASILAMFK